jgi:hypothetical protein
MKIQKQHFTIPRLCSCKVIYQSLGMCISTTQTLLQVKKNYVALNLVSTGLKP